MGQGAPRGRRRRGGARGDRAPFGRGLRGAGPRRQRREARTVPSPSSTTSVVTVKVGGDRDGDRSVAALAGTELGLYASETGGTPAYTCVSDADGDCSFTVPGTGDGGANHGGRFWVRQISAPAGWYTNPRLRTQVSTGSSEAYSFRTPPLYAGNTYSSTDSGANGFMVSSGSSNRTASGGLWQQSRNNPGLPRKCGLRVALVMDLSGSVSGGVPALKSAADTFVDSLRGTPSTMALFSFSSYSPADRVGADSPGLQSVSTQADADAFKAKYASWTNSTAVGATNWDRALYQPASAAEEYDVAVVITDGMPTRYSVSTDPQGNGSNTRFREVENGIYSANAFKAKGTRVLGLGVGSGVSGEAGLNLRAISGPTKYDGDNIATADYFQESDYTQVGRALRELALEPCTPSVSVIKQIRTADGTRFNAPAGWTFDGVTTTPGASLESPQTTMGDGTGAVNFPLTYDGISSSTVTVTEREKSGYQLVQQDGKNAACVNKVTEQPVEVTDDPGGGPGFTLDVPGDAPLSCVVVNQAPADLVPAQVRVDKKWVLKTPDGTRTYDEGEQPNDLAADLRLSDPVSGDPTVQQWGQTRTGYAEGDGVTVGERPRLTPGLDCTLDKVEFDGEELDPDDPSTRIVLEAGLNEHRMTNSVSCRTRLTLLKSVLGGDADPDDWNLQAIAPTGALPGPEGSSGATSEVSWNNTYQLAERRTDDDPELLNYKQTDNRTNFQTNPRSTGSMTCLLYDKDGDEVLGWNDGINGGVNVPLGLHAKCTAQNETVPLTLVKEVEGGDAEPGDWTLRATPVDPDPEGVPAQSVRGAPGPDGAKLSVRPGQRYRVTETDGPAGYVGEVECTVEGEPEAPGSPGSDTVTVPSGRRGVCTVTNTRRAARLTLEKSVDNAHGGTARPTDWTLSADGPSPVSGTTGSKEITDALVTPGTYRLSESGPKGYTASPWRCDGAGTTQGRTVEVADGAHVTCRITNKHKASPTPTPTPTAPSPAPHPAGGGGSGELPDTGESLRLALTGALLIAGGVYLFRHFRRRP